MEITKTVVCKLNPTDEQQNILYSTINKFMECCNFISKVAFEQKVFNAVALHHITYYNCKLAFKLPSNLVIRARDRVAKAYKTKKRKLIKFNSTSMDLDERIFRLIFKEDGIYASISTIDGRVKVPIVAGKYQRRLLNGTHPTNAVLVYKRKRFYLHIPVRTIIPEPTGNNPVGVDLGMNKLIVASNGFKTDGKDILRRRQQFRKQRETLQAKGTKSAKRKLKTVAGKESQWANTILHQISRQFVNTLNTGDIVVMENLTRIQNTTEHRKPQRADFHSWAFRKLQFLIRYKALERGIPVIFVDPKNTSQECPRCHHISSKNRVTQTLFRCINCGFQHNADVVASMNISRRAGSLVKGVVNTPNVGLNACKHSDTPTSPAL
jgi:IS605 OrfB family transposase